MNITYIWVFHFQQVSKDLQIAVASYQMYFNILIHISQPMYIFGF